jgi:hypothetical protein
MTDTQERALRRQTRIMGRPLTRAEQRGLRGGFGQAPVVYRAPVTPVMYMPYSTQFVRQQTTAPGQTYKIKLSAEQMEKEIYKDLPTAVKGKAVSSKTNPQKLIKLSSGLEVPAYILQRDRDRKTQGVVSKALPALPLGPVMAAPKKHAAFHKLGAFATKSPMIASLIVFGLGYFAGNWYYDFKQSQK